MYANRDAQTEEVKVFSLDDPFLILKAKEKETNRTLTIPAEDPY